jgi:hypothetical protein
MSNLSQYILFIGFLLKSILFLKPFSLLPTGIQLLMMFVNQSSQLVILVMLPVLPVFLILFAFLGDYLERELFMIYDDIVVISDDVE